MNYDKFEGQVKSRLKYVYVYYEVDLQNIPPTELQTLNCKYISIKKNQCITNITRNRNQCKSLTKLTES